MPEIIIWSSVEGPKPVEEVIFGVAFAINGSIARLRALGYRRRELSLFADEEGSVRSTFTGRREHQQEVVFLPSLTEQKEPEESEQNSPEEQERY